MTTIGETLALIDLPRSASIGRGSTVPLRIGGAESNVAIGLARLDVASTWISRLSHDGLAELVAREIRGEGVKVIAARDAVAPTGVMIKEPRREQSWRIRYYRTGSAASRLSPQDIDDDVTAAIGQATVLHLTGITAGLGPSPLATITHAIEIARAAGVLVSFDINYRAGLWSEADAAGVLANLVAAADLVFAGLDEAALVLGRSRGTGRATVEDSEMMAAELADRGPATAVIKLGELGALAWSAGASHWMPAQPVVVVDPVGAGDAFVAGYLSEVVRKGAVSDALRMGNILGAAVCGVLGDWEGLPTAADLAEACDVPDVVR